MPDQQLITIGISLVAVVVAYLVGRSSGRSTGRRSADKEAVTKITELTSNNRRLQREVLHKKEAFEKTFEVLINLPTAVNKMGSARSTAELCRITARSLVEVTGASKLGLYVAQGNPPVFKLEVFVGNTKIDRDPSFQFGEGRLGQLAQLIGVRGKGDLMLQGGNKNFADLLFRPDVCVTFRHYDTVHGFVAMDDLANTEDLAKRVVQMLADVHAVSAEGVRRLDYERLKADLDQLTGLFNRRHLDNRLKTESDLALNERHPLSVFLFDIDNFKHFNDTNGHQAGDVCLKEVAAITRKVTRSSDVVCRYGGEEFLVILLGADSQKAMQHAERIRQTIAASKIPHGENQPLGMVSVSGGVASLFEHGTNPELLVKLADEALYRAKEGGRNAVMLAELPGPSRS